MQFYCQSDFANFLDVQQVTLMLLSSELLSFRGNRFRYKIAIVFPRVELHGPIFQCRISVSVRAAVMNYQPQILQLKKCE